MSRLPHRPAEPLQHQQQDGTAQSSLQLVSAVATAGLKYETQDGETRTQASRRKLNELQDAYVTLDELVRIASTRADGLDVLQQIRNGEPARNVLSKLQQDRSSNQPELDTEHRDKTKFLGSLMQSKASLLEVVDLVGRLNLEDNWRHVFDWNAQKPQHQSPDVGNLNRLLDAARSSKRPVSSTTTRGPIAGSSETRPDAEAEQNATDSHTDTPTFRVPSQPWTRLTIDDNFVSHLVSLFMLTYNPYWRYVEEDLFLQDMQLPVGESTYCSSFLVNSICAMACFNSEREQAFVVADEFTTRGEHFHDEAMRLWLLEDGRVSLTNLQALTILSVESSLRGKDKLGVSILAMALQMNRDLSFPDVGFTTVISGHARARSCAAWTVHFTDVTISIALMRISTPLDPRLGVPLLEEVKPEWCLKETGPPTANSLFRERCVLTRLTSEVNVLLFSNESTMKNPNFAGAAEALKTRLVQWYELLPNDFIWDPQLPAPLYELHTEYRCAMMILCSSLERHTITELADGAIQPTSSQVAESVMHALETADILRSFRQKASLKLTLAFILQAEAVTSLMLLKYLNPTLQAREVQAAFEEAFRCLLGTATQIMMARGVARMVYQTSKQLGVPLPTTVILVMQAISETAWRPADILKISSSFPNYALVLGAAPVDRVGMEDLLKQWEAMDY